MIGKYIRCARVRRQGMGKSSIGLHERGRDDEKGRGDYRVSRSTSGSLEN